MGSDPKNKKYMFDLNNFDEDDDKEKKKAPPAPTFSLEDMESARKQAHEKGKEEGARIAKESIEQRTEILVQSIAHNFTSLDAQEDQRNKRFVDDSVLMTYKALKACLPSIMKDAAETEIKKALEGFFAGAGRGQSYKLFVHSDMKAAIEKYADAMHANITIQTDDSLAVSGSRIEWASGVAEWAPDKTAEAIIEIMKPFIHEKSELLDDSTKKTHNEQETPDDNAEPPVQSGQDGDS